MKLTAAREDILAPLQSVIGVVERRQSHIVRHRTWMPHEGYPYLY